MAAGSVLADKGIVAAGLTLIVGQSLLSYFIAGFTKLISSVWRNGEAVRGVMRTEAYGHPVASRIIRKNPGLGVVLGWTVISLELCFPFVIVLPMPAAICLLGVAAVFHILNAIFMGLNTFALSFPASYPAIITLNHYIHLV